MAALAAYLGVLRTVGEPTPWRPVWWFVSLSRPVKLLIGFLTAWPFLYMLVFFVVVATSMLWMTRTPADGSHSSGPPAAFLVLFAAHLLTMVLMVGLIAFYIVYLFKTDRVSQDKKALWAAVLFLGNMLAMPVFFVLYVWPDEWPRKTRVGGGTAA
jgi:hypothetical protein